MSGNRANAAARNRRSGGGPEMQPPMPQGRPQVRPGQPQHQQQQLNPGPGLPKQMTIQNAVALITIRLGRVETFMQRFDGENPSDENERLVDDGVFNSIVSRLDALERGHKLMTAKSVTTPVLNNESTDKLSEEVHNLKAEVSQVKDLLLKLQSFTMETNQKLLDVVMREDDVQKHLVFVENENDEEYSGQEYSGQDYSGQEYSGQDIVGSLNVNLKEIIQKELAFSATTEE